MSDRVELPRAERCETCRFWDCNGSASEVEDGYEQGDRYGYCMRMPPVWVPKSQNPESSHPCHWSQPAVFSCDWCGEYQPAIVGVTHGWSEDSPSEPGWYWYFHESLKWPEPYRVYRTPKKLMVKEFGGGRFNMRYLSGLWYGPIHPPTVAPPPPPVG